MAYNLPPFWSRGFALPDYVRIEDLQRRAFVTDQTPRGTYDDPDVGTAGYAVPTYVTNEGYGQGAVVTKWMPRGTAPLVKHALQQPRAVVVGQKAAAGGGDMYAIAASTSGPAPADAFRDYGHQVADHVLTSLQQVPAAQRRGALEAILGKIDPTLWTRVQKTAETLAQAGHHAKTALHAAIASEFQRGILSELARKGRASGRKASAAGAPGTPGGAPASTHLQGVGCYTCAALGDGPEVRTHAPADPTAVAAAQAQALLNINAKPPCGTKDAAGNLLTDCNPNTKLVLNAVVTIGPWTFKLPGGPGRSTSTIVYTPSNPMPPAVKSYLVSRIAQHGAPEQNENVTSAMKTFFGTKPISSMGISAANLYPGADYVASGTDYPHNPISDTVNVPAKNGESYGVFLFMDGKATPPYVRVTLAPASLAKPTYTGDVVNAVGDAVTSVVKAVGQLACGALAQPGAAAAATANPYAAAGVVATKASGVCDQPAPAAPAVPQVAVMPAPAGPSLTTMLLLGGVGIAAIYLLTSQPRT